MSTAPIGVFDSGVGGLTILKEIQRLLPNESLLYIGDTLNCPYGGRSPDEIYRLARNIMLRMTEHGVKVVVIACNTISVTCIQQLREEFAGLPIVGTAPAVKTAAAISVKRRIGVLSTVATANSSYQAALVNQFAADCQVTNLGTNELVPRIERGAWSTELPEVLPGILEPFHQADIDALVLGCSHYPLLRREIEAELGPGVTVLDSGEAIARQVGRVLEAGSLLAGQQTPTYQFVTTADSPALGHVLERLAIRASVTSEQFETVLSA